MPKDEVRSGIVLDGSQVLDTLDKISKKWEAFRKNVLEKYGPTLEEQRAAYAKLDAAVKQLSKTQDKNSKSAQTLLEVYRAEKTAVGQNVTQLEAYEKVLTKTVKEQKGVPTEAIESFKKFREQVAESFPTLSQVEQEIKRVNAELLAMRTSQQSENAATQEAINQDRLYLGALREQRDNLRKLRREQEAAARAQEQHNTSVKNSIKRLLTWGAGVASVYYLYRKLRVAVTEAFKDVYGETEQYKELDGALNTLKHTIVLSLTGYNDMLELLEKMADAVNKLSDGIAKLSARDAGLGAMADRLAEQTGKIGEALNLLYNIPSIRSGSKMGMQIIKWAQDLGLVNDELGLAAAYEEGYQERLDGIATGLNNTTDETKNYSNAIASLVDQYRKLAEAQREADAALAAAYDTYRSAQAIAQGNLAAGLMQIETDLSNNIAKINADALKARESAYRDYQDNLTKAQKDANRQRADDQARHDLEMEFARRRHMLTLLQNDRMYQYERALLVAEGDVLAIEDLDARTKLERQAQEENFQLQMEQAEAMFRLQARIMEEAMRDQVKQLQDALQAQLREIEENRRERVQAAEETADEERQAAKKAYAEALTDAEAAWKEAQDEKDKVDKKQLEDNAKFLAQFAIDNDIGLDKVLKVWQDVFGEDSELAREAEKAYNETVRLTDIFTNKLIPMMKTAGAEAGLAFNQGLVNTMGAGLSGGLTTQGGFRHNRAGYKGGVSSFAYGTDQIVSSPTPFIAGEGYSPERVIVQPLSPIGGNIGVSWQGNGIPINVNGASGLDAGQIGAAINTALQGFAMEYVRQRSGSRGQRGR